MSISKIDSGGITASGITADSLNIGQIGGRRNLIINGAMQVAQRGTSFSGNVYTLDRFKAGNNPTDISQNSSDVPSGFQYSMNLTGANHLINYRMESTDSFRLSGRPITLSFYAKNISGTNTLKVQLGHPSATDNFAIQTVLQTSSSITLTSGWERYEITFSSLSSEIEKGLFFYIYREGSTSTDQTRVTGVQLEVGTVATPFEHRSYGEELALCQRYYYEITHDSTNRWGIDGLYSNGTGAALNFSWTHPTTMRANPTFTPAESKSDTTYYPRKEFMNIMRNNQSSGRVEIEFSSGTSKWDAEL